MKHPRTAVATAIAATATAACALSPVWSPVASADFGPYPEVSGFWSQNCSVFTLTSTNDHAYYDNAFAFQGADAQNPTTVLYDGNPNFGAPRVFTGLDGSQPVKVNLTDSDSGWMRKEVLPPCGTPSVQTQTTGCGFSVTAGFSGLDRNRYVPAVRLFDSEGNDLSR